MPKCFVDYETANELDLRLVGVHNYAQHQSNRVILAAYAINDEPIKLIDSFDSPLRGEFEETLKNPDMTFVSWNCGFERLETKHFFGTDIPASRWEDPMISARFLSMPGKLEKVCEILKLEEGKLRGDKLKNLFCSPAHLGGEETLFGISLPRYNDCNSHPREWSEFCEYCKRDVEVLRKIHNVFSAHPLPECEKNGFLLDQSINNRGVPVDLELVQKMDKIALRAKKTAFDEIKRISGIENPNSRPQLLAWLKTQGYPYNSLEKSLVAASFDDIGMSENADKVLRFRKESAKTSDSKLEALKLMASPDGRVRDLFGYLGAPRTGRWNSHGPQFANQPRPVKKVEKNFERAVELILKEDFEGIMAEFGSVMDVISGCIRACYKAPDGQEFVIADYAAIEPRILGWLTNCIKIKEMFRKGEDCYLRFAEALYGIPYEKMVVIVDGKHECRPEYKEQRQMSKPGFLGCGYMLSGGEEYQNKDGDTVRNGVFGYAQQMGIDMPQDLAHKAVRVFRKEYSEVCDFWYNSDEAIKQVIRTKKSIKLGKLAFDIHGQTLRMLLPSGRHLHYIRPLIKQEEFKGKVRDQITFEGIDGKTKQWVRQSTHPGRVTENAVSGIARDALLEGMKEADKVGIPICAHVHDEIVGLAKKTESQKILDKLLACMRKSPSWGKDLILDAAGFASVRYKKG